MYKAFKLLTIGNQAMIILAIIAGLWATGYGIKITYDNSVRKEVVDDINKKTDKEIKKDAENVKDANDNLPDDVFSGLQSESSSDSGQDDSTADSRSREAYLLPESEIIQGNGESGTSIDRETLLDGGLFTEPYPYILQEEINADNPCFGIPDCY